MIQELFSIYNNQIYKSHLFQPNQTIIIQIDYIFSFNDFGILHLHE